MVWNGAFVTGNALLGGEAEAIDCARIEGEAQVSGNSSIRGDAVISGESRIWGNMVIVGRTRVSGESVLYGRKVLSEDREYHDYQMNYVDPHPGTPLFSKLQEGRGEKCLFCVSDTEGGRKVGIGVSLDVQMQRITVHTHCFGRKATWKDILAVLQEDRTLWRQLATAAKEVHKGRTTLWRFERIAGDELAWTFLIREKDETTCMFNTLGRITGRIRQTWARIHQRLHPVLGGLARHAPVRYQRAMAKGMRLRSLPGRGDPHRCTRRGVVCARRGAVGQRVNKKEGGRRHEYAKSNRGRFLVHARGRRAFRLFEATDRTIMRQWRSPERPKARRSLACPKARASGLYACPSGAGSEEEKIMRGATRAPFLFWRIAIIPIGIKDESSAWRCRKCLRTQTTS